MKCSAFALLCFSLLFPAAWAADPAPSSPTDTYILARDRTIAELKAHPSDEKLEPRALGELELLLRKAIGPWKAPGFSSEGKLNLSTLYEGDLGFGALDGLLYEAKGLEVVVTTPALFRHWLAAHGKRWEGRDDLPRSPEAAIHAEALYTFAIGGDLDGDAAAYSYGEIPITFRGRGAVLAVGFSQDLVMDSGPSVLAAAVIQGERVFVAQQQLTVAMVAPPVCRRVLIAALKRWAQSRNPDAGELADRDYRACFAKHLSGQPHYRAIVR